MTLYFEFKSPSAHRSTDERPRSPERGRYGSIVRREWQPHRFVQSNARRAPVAMESAIVPTSSQSTVVRVFRKTCVDSSTAVARRLRTASASSVEARAEARNLMKIAVTTLQSNVGRHLTRMLIRAGVRPVLLTRHPENLPAELTGHIELITTGSREPRQVISATAGVDAIYWVDPLADSSDPLDDYRRATESIIAAIETNPIGRVVFQPSVGAEKEKRYGAGEIDGFAETEAAPRRADELSSPAGRRRDSGSRPAES